VAASNRTFAAAGLRSDCNRGQSTVSKNDLKLGLTSAQLGKSLARSPGGFMQEKLVWSGAKVLSSN